MSNPPFKECLLSQRSAGTEPAPLSSRLPSFIGARVKAESVLNNLRAFVIGVGSVGMNVAFHLARLRIAELWLVDPQTSYKAESVLTHPITESYRQPKATVTARLCKKISPLTRVFSFVGKVQDLSLDAFARAHLCVLATDNLAAEVEVGRRCLHLGVRLVHAALHGETLIAQVRVFANANGQGPCPACGFGAVEWRQLSEQTHFSCDGGPSRKSALRISGPPTRSASHLCSMAADVATNQILRLVLHLGDPVEDTIVEYCGFTNRIVTGRLERNPDCRGDHTRFKLERSAAPLKGYSFQKLAREFGFDASDGSLTLRVEGANWVERGGCQCAEPVPVHRFVPTGRARAGRCAQCRSAIQVLPFYQHQTVSAAVLAKAAATPLSLLGALRIPWVLLRTADRAVLVQDPARVGSMS